MSSEQRASHPKAGSIAWTITRRLAMVVVLALAFFLSATITIYTLFRIGDTRVPDVIGKPETEARALAEKAGLKVKIQPRNDPTVPTGLVIETKPGPNASVKKDSPLTIFVSNGPPNKSENKTNDAAHQVCGLQVVSAGSKPLLAATNYSGLQMDAPRLEAVSDRQPRGQRPLLNGEAIRTATQQLEKSWSKSHLRYCQPISRNSVKI